MYNDKLVYKVVIWVFWVLLMKREGNFNIYYPDMSEKT